MKWTVKNGVIVAVAPKVKKKPKEVIHCRYKLNQILKERENIRLQMLAALK